MKPLRKILITAVCISTLLPLSSFGQMYADKFLFNNPDYLLCMTEGQDIQFEQSFRAVKEYDAPKPTLIIDGLYQAFAKGDIPTVLNTLDDQVVWNEAEGNSLADGNPYIGPDAVLNGIFARIGADYEYFKLKDIKLHDMANDQVLATLRYDAKLKKNEAVIDAQVAHLWTLRDGKVTAFQQYVDTKQLAEAESKQTQADSN